MTQTPLGVAVIGAGMVGRAHANAYRQASTVFGLDQPAARLVAIADLHEPFATDAATRYGYARAETDWRAVVEAPDVDAVSVAVANSLHREVVEAALAAGKHVLCEKPLVSTRASTCRAPTSSS